MPVAVLDLGVQGLQLLLFRGYGAPSGILLQLQILHLHSHDRCSIVSCWPIAR